jgi:hypothetical protein
VYYNKISLKSLLLIRNWIKIRLKNSVRLTDIIAISSYVQKHCILSAVLWLLSQYMYVSAGCLFLPQTQYAQWSGDEGLSWLSVTMRGLRDEYNGFWIGWLDFLAFLLQLQSTIPAHNQWLSRTRSIRYWTTSVFSSTVSDLGLIHENASVTSSASFAHWLKLHSWTLNSLTNDKCRTTAHSLANVLN